MSALASDEEIFRIKWEDIERVPQDDGPNPVVAINYSPKCNLYIFSIATNDTACVKHKIPQIYVYSILITVTELMDLFRGIQRIGEISDRVLELTTELLSINPVIQSCINLMNPYQCVNRFRCTPAKANYTVWKYRRDCLKYLHVC